MSFDYKSEIINELQKERNALSHRVGELEATLERVKKLPETWRVKADWLHDKGGSEQLSKADGFDKCADELEDELSGIQGKALDGESSVLEGKS